MLEPMQINTLGELNDRRARPTVRLERIDGYLAANSCPESYRQAWLLGHFGKCTDRARGFTSRLCSGQSLFFARKASTRW